MVWVVPIVAVLLGAWLLFRNFTTQGPLAHVRFDTAEGIDAGKTEVRCRSVKVGYVRDVVLADDLKSVSVVIEFSEDGQKFMRRGSRFWVVRPRLSASGVSGVGTLITGAYIEMEPGPGNAERVSNFTGLEKPPGINSSVPGRRITLFAEEASSISGGSPIYYRGYPVGRIEEPLLDVASNRVRYDAFIEEKYSRLVTENTRFWNASGIDITAGASGFKVRTPSLQSLISGGVAFGVPEKLQPGAEIRDGKEFTLYPDASTAENSAFNPTLRFLLLFNQSVRGLQSGAPVEFRGIQIGRVADVSFDLVKDAGEPRIPVLIEIDPLLMRPETAEEVNKPDSVFFREEIGKGLRASLKTANLITSSLYVDLDYYKDTAPATLGRAGEYATFPTVSSGLAQLEAKVSAILDKIQSLPMEEAMANISATAAEAKITVAEARAAIAETEKTVAALRVTLEDPKFRGLPADLSKTLATLEESVRSLGPESAMQGDMLRTLDELRGAMRSIKSLAKSINEDPGSLIWDNETSGNPKPKAPRKSKR